MKTNLLITIKIALSLFITMLSLTSTAQQDYYWVGGTGNWSDYANHWATSSGGSVFHSSEPGTSDFAYFDENSFTEEGQVVTIDDRSIVYLPGMDWSTATYEPKLYRDGVNAVFIYNSVTFSPDMEIDAPRIWFETQAGSPIEFDPNGLNLDEIEIEVRLNNQETFSLKSPLTTDVLSFTSNYTTNAGTFISNGHDIDVNTLLCSIRIDGSFDFTNSTIYAQTIDFSGDLELGEIVTTNATLIINKDGGSSTFNDENPLTYFETFVIGANNTITGEVETNPSFYSLEIRPGVELLIDETLGGIELLQIIANGTSDDPISIKSITDGEQATLIMSGATVDLDYVNLQDIEATGGATFNATHSLDLGNVSGINFIQTEDQEIMFEEIPDTWIGDSSIQLGASSSSGLDVSYVVTGPASIDGNTLTLNDVGEITVTANQEGNTIYFEADDVTRSFSTFKKDQTITFAELPDVDIDDESIALNASSSSELPITYSVEGPGQLDGSSILLQDLGTITVTASQGGGDYYNEATSVSQQFEVLQILGLEGNFNITVYPNPTSDEIIIEAKEELEIYLYNSEGRQLYFTKSKNGRIDISNYTGGMYTLKIGQGGEWSSRKIIIK